VIIICHNHHHFFAISDSEFWDLLIYLSAMRQIVSDRKEYNHKTNTAVKVNNTNHRRVANGAKTDMCYSEVWARVAGKLLRLYDKG